MLDSSLALIGLRAGDNSHILYFHIIFYTTPFIDRWYLMYWVTAILVGATAIICPDLYAYFFQS